MVVATAQSALRTELVEAGVHEVLDKPLDLDELMGALLGAVISPAAHF